MAVCPTSCDREPFLSIKNFHRLSRHATAIFFFYFPGRISASLFLCQLTFNDTDNSKMAAMKHSLEEDHAVRPSKKSKVDDVEKAQLKKGKKDKKKEKKRKTEEESGSDAEKKARKAEKKARKEEKRKAKEAAEAEASEPKAKAESKKSDSSKTEPSGPYTQTKSLSDLPQSEIDTFLSTNEILVTDPKNATVTLRPITEFKHLPESTLLDKKPFGKYKAPTSIQAASWPFTLSGRDVVGVAETGSGKTMAFALPCVEAVSAMNKRGTKAVIVSPTRELAMQTHEQLSGLAALLRLKCVCLYGGSSKDDQRALISRGADIIVATPGRLKDFMSDGTVNLSGVGFAVLDEADRMLDKGFEDDIKGILGECPAREKRQTLMFTATWPQSVQSLAATFMVSPVKVTIGGGGKETESGAVELQANVRITQSVEVMEPQDKEFRLLQILKQRQQGAAKNDRILVFCLYKKEATRVENTLSRKGIKVGGIHGDLRQEQRTKSLEAFKQGHTPVLVATDVAARGLDIPEVKLVINVTVSCKSQSVKG